MKKIVRVEIVAEIEVDSTWYNEDGIQNGETESTDKEIIEAEKENWQEWILENVVSEKVSIRDKK